MCVQNLMAIESIYPERHLFGPQWVTDSGINRATPVQLSFTPYCLVGRLSVICLASG